MLWCFFALPMKMHKGKAYIATARGSYFCLSFENRARIQIIANLLEIAKNPTKKTRMLYGANLSFKQAEQYLELLSKANLLSKKEGDGKRKRSIIFLTTSNGRRFLKHYDALLKLAPFLE